MPVSGIRVMPDHMILPEVVVLPVQVMITDRFRLGTELIACVVTGNDVYTTLGRAAC